MAFDVTVLESAFIELDEAVSWYEFQKLSLGSKLFNEFTDALDKIAKHPHHYSFTYKQYRQFILKTF